MSNEIVPLQAVFDLARFLRDRHGEPVHIPRVLIPPSFSSRFRDTYGPDADPTAEFLDKLLVRDPEMLREFLHHLGSLVHAGIVRAVDQREIQSVLESKQ